MATNIEVSGYACNFDTDRATSFKNLANWLHSHLDWFEYDPSISEEATDHIHIGYRSKIDPLQTYEFYTRYADYNYGSTSYSAYINLSGSSSSSAAFPIPRKDGQSLAYSMRKYTIGSFKAIQFIFSTSHIMVQCAGDFSDLLYNKTRSVVGADINTSSDFKQLLVNLHIAGTNKYLSSNYRILREADANKVYLNEVLFYGDGPDGASLFSPNGRYGVYRVYQSDGTIMGTNGVKFSVNGNLFVGVGGGLCHEGSIGSSFWKEQPGCLAEGSDEDIKPDCTLKYLLQSRIHCLQYLPEAL